MGDRLESVKQLLRSVLLSSKTGVKATRLQGEYKELCGSYIPHDKLGFSTLHEFMVSIDDVVRVSRNFQNELTYFAIADSSTQHIQAMIAKQKPKKVSKKAASSYIRNKSYCKPRSSTLDFNNQYIPSKFKSLPYGNSKKEMLIKRCQSDLKSKPMSFAKSGVLSESFHNLHNTHGQSMLAKDIVPFSSQQKIVGHLNHSGMSVYQNPLISYDKENSSDGLSEESSIGVKALSDTNLNKFDIKANLKKLLSVNAFGLPSTNICSLYKDTYNANFPTTLLNDIVSGTLSGYAKVEKLNVNGNTQFLLFPPENKVEANCNSNNNDLNYSCSSSLSVKSHSPLIPGEDYVVSIVKFESCSKIFVHLSSEKKLKKEMLQLIKELFSQPNAEGFHNQNIQCGSYVVTKDYFRAKVLSINNSQVELFHIDLTDSTTTYWTTLDQVQLMPLSITKYPEFCICCSMHRPGTGEWQPQSNKMFCNLYSSMELVLTPITVSTMKSVNSSSLLHDHFVLFYRKIGGGRSNINVKLIKEETACMEMSKVCCDPFAFQPTKYATLPSEEYCELYILNASCCTELDVCVIGEGYSDLLVQLEDKMFEYYSNTKESFKLPPVLPVDCIYAVLSEETCVRGKLISVSFDQALVYLIDSGDTDTVSISTLLPLQESFSLLPMQAFKVSLCGLEHEACATHSKILQLLNETVVFKACTAHVVDRFAHADSTFTYMVELFDNTGPIDRNINQACYELILDDNLLPDILSDNKEQRIEILPNIGKEVEVKSVESENQPQPLVDSALPSVKTIEVDSNHTETHKLYKENQKFENTTKLMQVVDNLSSPNKANACFVGDVTHNSLIYQSSESDASLVDSKPSITELVNNLIDKKTKMQIGHSKVNFDKNPLLVRVEEAESPDYIQMIALKNLPARNILTTVLTLDHYKQFESKEMVGNLQEGHFYTLCDTDAKCCYRVRLITQVSEEVNVYLIDYGECRLTKARNLTVLHEKFQSIEPFMITARLSGIEPLGNDKKVWAFEISEKLSKLIKGNCYFAHVLKVVESTILQGHDVWDICLCDTISKSDVWINDLLVDQWGCAKYVE